MGKGASLRDRAARQSPSRSVSALRASIASAVAGIQIRPAHKSRPPNRMKGRHRKATLKKLAVAQGWRCGLCGKEMGIEIGGGMSLDHVFPMYLRFSNVGNMIAAHRDCNTRKGDCFPTGCEIIWLHVANTILVSTRHGQSYGTLPMLRRRIHHAQAMSASGQDAERLGAKPASAEGDAP